MKSNWYVFIYRVHHLNYSVLNAFLAFLVQWYNHSLLFQFRLLNNLNGISCIINRRFVLCVFRMHYTIFLLLYEFDKLVIVLEIISIYLYLLKYLNYCWCMNYIIIMLIYAHLISYCINNINIYSLNHIFHLLHCCYHISIYIINY